MYLKGNYYFTVLHDIVQMESEIEPDQAEIARPGRETINLVDGDSKRVEKLGRWR